uniref:Uncharacterized protein n=1 Tax=Salix viminalis TaxID=40686 RepID=A0A6N2N337_SALVM
MVFSAPFTASPGGPSPRTPNTPTFPINRALTRTNFDPNLHSIQSQILHFSVLFNLIWYSFNSLFSLSSEPTFIPSRVLNSFLGFVRSSSLILFLKNSSTLSVFCLNLLLSLLSLVQYLFLNLKLVFGKFDIFNFTNPVQRPILER